MMDTRRVIRRGAVAALALVIGGSAQLQAQDLPAAEDLVARYRQLVGAEAFAQKQVMHSVGEFAMPAMGLAAPFEGWASRPNLSASRIAIPGFGEFLRGHTGSVAWAMDPMEGPRLLEGDMAAEAGDDAAFDSGLRPDELVASMTTVERTTLAGRDCYKVQVNWRSGRETFDCYSPESGLLVGSMMRQKSPMGEIDAVVLYDDYREFEGVTLATKMTVQVMGNEQIVTLREVHFTPAPEDAFEPPAEIRALIGG
jgi:hypothetical protein